MFCVIVIIPREWELFLHQNQSEYDVRNLSVSIEGIVLDKLSVLTQIETKSSPESRTRHDVCSLFLYDDKKNNAATKYAHIKKPI